jgi:hypothetical protein
MSKAVQPGWQLRWGLRVWLGIIAVLFTGCHSIGPASVTRDRFDYSVAISDSWKRQTLLNMVKLRYLDLPIFVEVGQIVSGYTLEADASVGGTAGFGGAPTSTLTLNGLGRYIDRPTITYEPLTGNRFISTLMASIPPDALFNAIQSGWPADVMLTVGVASINGLKNENLAAGGAIAPDPKFIRVTELMRQIQLSGGINTRVTTNKESGQAALLTFRSKDMSPETLAASRELRTLLGLSQEASEFKLVLGTGAADDKEVAVFTRSLLHAIGTLSMGAEVPPEDVAEGRATRGAPPSNEGKKRFRIHCSKSEPQDAYVTIFYRKHWFWIDDRDLVSKRGFALIMFLITLSDKGTEKTPPVLTIPTQ